ncbi:universal stress protein [Actinokineospora auranticolor]|uniref:Nucleotide-binding universal stress UspA family protein n=1 Tax=Actinokineospora auranticolor TaxID=155976 RepID=A0A2S6GP48_9PSEU|nr:universal stress protein [Actinokineospora auranticolor]PPK67008.1 nucleotide-binding universal stress UspA family protein [Actinokineospora auranticolor]
MTASHDQVVVGIDGSDTSLTATKWAADEARRRGTTLSLVHACVPPAVRHPTTLASQADYIDALTDHGRVWLREARAVARHAAPGLPVRQDLRVGQAAAVVLEAAERAALVVVGSRGLGGFRALTVGSVSTAVAHHASCPVVVIREGIEPNADGPVVVGVEGSPASDAALAFAFAQAARRALPLVAVHTWSDVAYPGLWTAVPLGVDWGEVTESEAALLDARLAAYRVDYPDVPVRPVVTRDRPVRALLTHADSASLLVVGNRRRHALTGPGTGSTSTALLHLCPCPLAVVRP